VEGWGTVARFNPLNHTPVLDIAEMG